MIRSLLTSTCLALLALAAALPVQAAPVDGGEPPRFHLTTMALLMPQATVGKRIAIDNLVALTDTIVAETNRWATGLDAAQAVDNCTIFVAVRPDRRLKTWTACRSFDGSALDARIARELDEKRIPSAKGLVLYAIHGRNADRDAFPDAWKATLDGKESEVLMSAIVDKVWPE